MGKLALRDWAHARDAGDVVGPSPYGSGVRDFIHVMDLVEGHLGVKTQQVVQLTRRYEVAMVRVSPPTH
jgi:hypothetical protein